MGSKNENSNSKLWSVSFSKEETQNLRKKHIGSSIQTFFKEDPLKIIEGHGQYLFDENNVKYLDCINNVAHVGHSHPTVVEACTQQISKLNTNIRFLHDNVLHLAKKLTDTLPAPLEMCYFVNSGSEANDLALRLGKYYNKSSETIVFENAYHGHLTSCILLSPYKFQNPNSCELKPDWVHVVATPDFYRGKYKRSDPDHINADEDLLLVDQYVAEVRKVCEELQSKNRRLGMFFLEALQGCGGQILYPKLYWRKIAKLVKDYGGLLVVDEVQTGFGRVGSHFWGFQLDDNDIVPDIVTLGKPMGNGYPIAAVITTKEIGDAFGKGPEYFNTYGGNPVACAVALAVLEIIEKDNLMENARNVGQQLIDGLNKMKEKITLIGEVRGAGLFIGIDIVRNRLTRQPATEETREVTRRLRQRGIIISRDGPYDNVLKIKPPMCFNKEDANLLLSTLEEILFDIQTKMLV